MSDSLQARFLARLERDPERRAVAFYGGPGELAWQSRGELFERAAAVAARLADLELGVDDVCLMMLPSDEEVPGLILGALLLGSAPLVAAPPAFWESRRELAGFVRRLVERSGASVVVGDVPQEEELGELGARVVRAHELVQATGESGTSPAPVGSSGEIAAMQLTSGTTGTPRVCVWRQGDVLAALDGMAESLGRDENEACFNWTPLYHDLGLVNCFLYCLTRGVPMTLMSPVRFVREPALWLRGLSETRSTLTWSPNFGYSLVSRRARDPELEGVRLDHVTGFWNAAERVHLGTMRDFHRRFEPLGVSRRSLRTSYGCAENVGGATFSRARDRFRVEHLDRRRLWEERRASRIAESDASEPVMGVGSAHPGVSIEIVGEHGRRVPEGQVGEIHLRTASRMKEYLGEPEATEAATRGGVLRTGDLGYLRDDELFWVGRVRERISVRGLKLDPSAFEQLLLDISGLREGAFAAFGVDDARVGTQRLVLVSEVRRQAEASATELAAEVRRRVFGGLQVQVADVVLVPEGTLQKTSSGKRRNRRCRALYESGGFSELRIGEEGHV